MPAAMAIAVASAAVYMELDDLGRIQCVRAALGSVASTPVRVPHADGSAEVAFDEALDEDDDWDDEDDDGVEVIYVRD